jgi:hypothetical protein
VVVDLREAEVLVGEDAQLIDGGIDRDRAASDRFKQFGEPALVDVEGLLVRL